MADSDMMFLGPTTEFPALMTDKLTSMRDNGTLTDFTITTRDSETKLPCHKVVLAIHSPYLEAMFTTDMVEAATNTVHYDHIDFATMKLILDYCYSEQIAYPANQLMPLITASDYLQIERLNKRCVNQVQSFLNPENVLKFLTFAGSPKSLKDIKTWCLELIVKSFSEVTKQPEFLALTYDFLQECVKDVIRSDVKRDDVLAAAFKWVNEDGQSRGKHLDELLHQVDLTLCSLPAIIDAMITYKVMIANCKVLGLLTQSVTAHSENIKTSKDPSASKTFLNPENALQYLTLAGEHSLHDLKSLCLEIVGKRFAEVSGQPAFLCLTYEEIREVMTKVAESVVESDEVLRAIFKWVNDNAESRGKHLEELLRPVQLDKCSVHAIHDVLEAHQTLIRTNAKVYSLLIKSAKKKFTPAKKTLVTVGGKVGDVVNPTCWSVDTKAKKFSESFTIPFDELRRIHHSVCETPGGFALTGGNDSDMCVVFVSSTMSWKIMPKMKRKRNRHGSICIKGILYVLCGWSSDSNNKSVDCIPLANGQWESLPDALITARYPILAELNNKIYMLEQYDCTDQLFRYDVETKEWEEKARLPGNSTDGASMIAVNDKLCVAGGNHTGICAWYNPANDTWSMGQQKPNKIHRYGSLVQVDTATLLLLGGNYGDGTDEIEELNIEDGSWSVKEFKMPAKLLFHKALFLDLPQEDRIPAKEEQKD